VHSLQGQRFDLIFADTWAGKYRLLSETLALLNPGGLYVIDDMLPQPNWPEGHADKVAALLATLEQLDGYTVTKMSWASGVVLVSKR
jgi:predicted O-methyltransferase YrrM